MLQCVLTARFLSPARYRPGRAARGGAPVLASSLARRIPRFFGRGGRAVRHPIPGPPAPSGIAISSAAESCTPNVPVAFSNLRFAPRDAHASLSLTTREMALESLPQLSASFSSCRRPSLVSEYYFARRPYSDVFHSAVIQPSCSSL